MHIDNIHEAIECLSKYAKEMIECGTGNGRVNLKDAGDITDMVKDLAEAEYYSKISAAMDKEDEEEKKQDEYALMRLKEEYGEDEGQRYYNEWRYANGRYAPKGRGNRRGYTVPIHFLISPKSGYMSPEEYERDMDRMDGKMYYPDGRMPSDHMTHNGGRDGDMRTYSDGYEEGNRRGYEDGNREGYERGYSEGERRGRSMSQRDGREGRSGQSRRSYMESKEMHTDNSPESKQAKMKELEKYMNELSSDMAEMINGASNEEKTMLRTKLQNLQQKIV